jgi:hypothetical protein
MGHPSQLAAANCAKPVILPERIMWCNTEDSATVTQWLLHRDLPWWFFGSFLNHCVRVYDRRHPRRKTRPRCTLAQRRLLACLGQYPMSPEELTEVMKIYLGGGATWGMLDKGLLISLRELSEFEVPPKEFGKETNSLQRTIQTPNLL